MKRHELKTWPPYYEEVEAGRKNFELRRNDRGFGEGDTLVLREYAFGKYTGRQCERRVSYLLTGYGLEPGYVALGLSDPVSEEE